MFKTLFFSAALLISLQARAQLSQVPWPSFMPDLEVEASSSPIQAILADEVDVLPAEPGLSANQARWQGYWVGWACLARACDVRLAIESVSSTGARISYASASERQKRFERFEAKFIQTEKEGIELRGQFSNGFELRLRLRESINTIEFLVGSGPTQFSAGVLGKVAKEAKDTRTPENAHQHAFAQRSVERIPTPFQEDGKPVSLEVVIFKPNGPGPFPLAVINHGSTGSGDQPIAFKSTWATPVLAKYFVDRGYMVAYPQRRGRGKSDGLYDEGFETNRSRYTCNADITLAGFDRALSDIKVAVNYLLRKPEVQAKESTKADGTSPKVFMSGVSRGGILSVAYAGMYPEQVSGVVNFVGGWIGGGCLTATSVNGSSFARGAAFPKPMLWLYGERDPFYSIAHSRQNFEAFTKAGGKGRFEVFPFAAGENGHGLHAVVGKWKEAVDGYLK